MLNFSCYCVLEQKLTLRANRLHAKIPKHKVWNPNRVKARFPRFAGRSVSRKQLLRFRVIRPLPQCPLSAGSRDGHPRVPLNRSLRNDVTHQRRNYRIAQTEIPLRAHILRANAETIAKQDVGGPRNAFPHRPHASVAKSPRTAASGVSGRGVAGNHKSPSTKSARAMEKMMSVRRGIAFHLGHPLRACGKPVDPR